ncbi:hypothetical protein COLO4_35532 [Corchorus olitorius]|uniref:Uncharacterized protein n=1 Tax=Corchorus olitorius TaxID=93759 RepID=A0A1R3GFT8_9ROSI|nr:hypothetical protein COLO4_35532 [Corchorus olitorius]
MGVFSEENGEFERDMCLREKCVEGKGVGGELIIRAVCGEKKKKSQGCVGWCEEAMENGGAFRGSCEREIIRDQGVREEMGRILVVV